MKSKASHAPIIGITGSAGKSTTKEMLASILKTKWNVLKSKKHSNKNQPHHTKHFMGKIKSSHQAVVLELGLGRKSGRRHFRYVQPTIGVITNVGSAHYGKLGNSLIAIAKSKSLLIKHLHPKGTLFINHDDSNSKLLNVKQFKGKVFSVGFNRGAHYQAKQLTYLKNGMRFQVKLNNKNENFYIPTFGEHNVINALFAIAISDQLNFSVQQMKRGLKNFQSPARRLNVITLPNESVLIDDSFNANPQSVKVATDVLCELGKNKTKVAVIGSMLELGKYSNEAHREIGHYIAKQPVDMLFTLGHKAKRIGKVAINKGLRKNKVHHFTDQNKLHRRLKSSIKPRTVILVKGSHRMNLMETAEFIAKYSIRS